MTFAHRLTSLVLVAIALVLSACGGASPTQPPAQTDDGEPTAPSQATIPVEPTGADAAPTPTPGQGEVGGTATAPMGDEPTTTSGPMRQATAEPSGEATAEATSEATAAATLEPTAAATEPAPEATEHPTAAEEPSGRNSGAAAGQAYTGTVVDGSGEPVARAMVYAGDEMVTTDARGRFSVRASGGAKELTVMAPGFVKRTATLGGRDAGRIALEPFVAKAVYVSGIGDESVREEFLELIEDTELNAIVINVKNDNGNVFTSDVPLARQVGASYEDFYLRDVVDDLHERGIYVIGRFTTFRDETLPRERPELAVRDLDGNVWSDNQDHTWLDPFRREVWDYLGDLGEEIAESGIDEIQFDYVRFPVDGDLDSIQYKTPSTRVNRPQTINGFMGYMEGRLRPHKVFISADTFGLTVVSDEEQGTGQILEQFAPHLDYYSPMIYPDHYSPGSFGYDVPSKYPYEVIYESVEQAKEKLEGTGVLVRPYLSAFRDTQYGQPFGLPQFQAQKEAAEEAGAHGWIFWNAGLTYPEALFRPE
jgi:hypothetical protein